jgi:hypothetical protein
MGSPSRFLMGFPLPLPLPGAYRDRGKADKKAAWDNEEERRRSLGFPSQSVRRDYKAEWPYYKPHYQHLKEGIKVASCWLCDQNNAEQDQRHREIWGRLEREEAEKNRTVGNA